MPDSRWNGSQRSVRTCQSSNSSVQSRPLDRRTVLESTNRGSHLLEIAECLQRGYSPKGGFPVSSDGHSLMMVAHVTQEKLARDNKIREVVARIRNDKVLIKCVRKFKAPREVFTYLAREVKALRALPYHPHVVYLHEAFETEANYYVVTEYRDHWSLQDYVDRTSGTADGSVGGGLPEAQAREIFTQICKGLNHCHRHGVVHRDICCNNIQLDIQRHAKLSEFCFANVVPNKRHWLRDFYTTLGYAAPEVLMGRKYDSFLADIWSLGIVLYVMLNGTVPFKESSVDSMLERMCRLRFHKTLSAEVTTLVRKMLEFDPSKRPRANEILRDPWVKGKTGSRREKTTFHYEPPPNSEEEFSMGDSDSPHLPLMLPRAAQKLQKLTTVTVNKENREKVLLKSRLQSRSSNLYRATSGFRGKRPMTTCRRRPRITIKALETEVPGFLSAQSDDKMATSWSQHLPPLDNDAIVDEELLAYLSRDNSDGDALSCDDASVMSYKGKRPAFPTPRDSSRHPRKYEKPKKPIYKFQSRLGPLDYEQYLKNLQKNPDSVKYEEYQQCFNQRRNTPLPSPGLLHSEASSRYDYDQISSRNIEQQTTRIQQELDTFGDKSDKSVARHNLPDVKPLLQKETKCSTWLYSCGNDRMINKTFSKEQQKYFLNRNGNRNIDGEFRVVYISKFDGNSNFVPHHVIKEQEYIKQKEILVKHMPSYREKENQANFPMARTKSLEDDSVVKLNFEVDTDGLENSSQVPDESINDTSTVDVEEEWTEGTRTPLSSKTFDDYSSTNDYQIENTDHLEKFADVDKNYENVNNFEENIESNLTQIDGWENENSTSAPVEAESREHLQDHDAIETEGLDQLKEIMSYRSQNDSAGNEERILENDQLDNTSCASTDLDDDSSDDEVESTVSYEEAVNNRDESQTGDTCNNCNESAPCNEHDGNENQRGENESDGTKDVHDNLQNKESFTEFSETRSLSALSFFNENSITSKYYGYKDIKHEIAKDKGKECNPLSMEGKRSKSPTTGKAFQTKLNALPGNPKHDQQASISVPVLKDQNENFYRWEKAYHLKVAEMYAQHASGRQNVLKGKGIHMDKKIKIPTSATQASSKIKEGYYSLPNLPNESREILDPLCKLPNIRMPVSEDVDIPKPRIRFTTCDRIKLLYDLPPRQQKTRKELKITITNVTDSYKGANRRMYGSHVNALIPHTSVLNKNRVAIQKSQWNPAASGSPSNSPRVNYSNSVAGSSDCVETPNVFVPRVKSQPIDTSENGKKSSEDQPSHMSRIQHRTHGDRTFQRWLPTKLELYGPRSVCDQRRPLHSQYRAENYHGGPTGSAVFCEKSSGAANTSMKSYAPYRLRLRKGSVFNLNEATINLKANSKQCRLLAKSKDDQGKHAETIRRSATVCSGTFGRQHTRSHAGFKGTPCHRLRKSKRSGTGGEVRKT